MKRASSVFAAAALTAALCSAPRANATDTSTAFSRAHAVWEQGDFGPAEKLYASAIAAGGLDPEQLVEAWARQGAALALAGKSRAAVDAFRSAAVLNSKFSVPSEAGPKAETAAATAKSQVAALGEFELRAEVPKTATPGEAWGWTVVIDSGHASLVDRVSARWNVGGKTSGGESVEKPGASRVSFLSTKSVPKDASELELRIAAQDKRGNTMKTLVLKVPVKGAEPTKSVTSPAAATPAGTTPKAVEASGGFWHSAWPWVIGGAVLAAGGGAAYYYYGVRTPPSVTVEAPTISGGQ